MRTRIRAISIILILAGALLGLQGVNRADAAIAEHFHDCKDCPEMVRIPAGSFMMGASANEHVVEHVGAEYAGWELPRHSVRISHAIAMGQFDVTRAQYAAFVAVTHREDHGCQAEFGSERAEFQNNDKKSWHDPGFPQTENDPVVCISWDDAVAYAAWLSAKTHKKYRLPTEAEWEYAARGGTATFRYWGDGRDQACIFANGADAATAAHYGWSGEDKVFNCNDGYVFTSPVGSFAPNSFGLYDMLGNAWNWTQDCFHPNYVGAPADGTAWDAPSCEVRVFRGGGWLNSPVGLRAASRGRRPVQGRFNVGFRVVRAMN